MESKSKIEGLREAHIKHELAQFRGDRLTKSLDREISAFFDWSESVQLKELTTPEVVIEFLKDQGIPNSIPKEVENFCTQAVKEVVNVISHDSSLVEDIVPRKEFEQFADIAIDLEELRYDIVNRIVNSPVYSLLISDVLFNGIKDFILTENLLAKSVPGVSSLMQFGKGLVSMAAPELEKKVNKKLVAFIQSNIQGTISQSEEFLKETLDKSFLKENSLSWWTSTSKESVADLTEYLLDEHIDAIVPTIFNFWRHLRETTFFSNIYETVVYSFFEKYGEKNIQFILEGFGLEQERVKSCIPYLIPLIEKKKVFVYLEDRIRAKLNSFYDLPETAALLE